MEKHILHFQIIAQMWQLWKGKQNDIFEKMKEIVMMSSFLFKKSLIRMASYRQLPHLILRKYQKFVKLFSGAFFSNGSFTLAKFVKRHCQRQWHATVTIELALANLGDATQIGSFLFMSLHPRWPRQISSDCRCRRHYCMTFSNVNMA